jgi:hypothetical protein
MNPACTPNGANASFVPGERSHFQVVASTATVSRMRPWRCLSFPFNLIFMVLPSFAVLPRWRADRGGRPVLPPQASNKKPRRGGQPRGGVLWARGGSEGHLPLGRLARSFHQRRWPSVRFATLEPGNRFDYPHVQSFRLPRRTGWRVPLEQHLQRRAGRNRQTTWMTPRTAPPRSSPCARPCATAASRRRRVLNSRRLNVAIIRSPRSRGRAVCLVSKARAPWRS